MMNKKRQLIFDKTDGHCFYCGCDLTGTRWQADHAYPIIRHPENGTCVYPELDVIDNLVPSCAPCNNFKSASTIEGFRWNINEQYANTLKNSTGLRQMQRLGLIEFKDQGKFEFWFEKQGIELPCRYKMLGINPEVASLNWKYDNDDRCHYLNLDNHMLTLRMINNEYLAILTRTDWNQERLTIPYQAEQHAKYTVADWALNYMKKD